ncbi:hypothetical protein [Flindersiella endophytica]
MRTFVTYDENGEIQSVMQADVLPASMDPDLPEVPPVPPGSSLQVVEIPAGSGVVKLSPLEIHENYRFDVKRGKLVRKRQSARPESGTDSGEDE